MKVMPIDTSTTEGKIKVMQLAADGRKVAYRSLSDARSVWRELYGPPCWNWGYSVFGIIEEPREIWVNFYPVGASVHTTKEVADARAARDRIGEAVLFREVVE